MPQKIGLIALWALNIILYAVIVVAGIESVATLSPVWPVTVACVLVYAVIIAVLWQKIDLALKWELSAALLAALLAYSGWRTGSLGAPGGLTVIGQSADVAAAALLILILASAAITIAFTKPVPWWLRAAIGLILIYAMIPLIDALAHGAGLGAALRTNAPFPSDPYWIRGSFIGASIVLPLAGLAALILAIAAAIRKHGAAALRLAAGGLALVLAAQMSGLEAVNAGLPALPAFEGRATAWVVPPPTSQSNVPTPGNTQAGSAQSTVAMAIPQVADYQAAATGSLTTPKPAPATDPQQLAPQFDKLVQTLQPATYDLDQRAQALGSDVNTIFAFVRDQIRFESYSGVLRGAYGTYTARAGNAADRSFLLAHILKAKGIPVRLAMGRLAEADAAKLYDRIFEQRTRSAVATPASLPALGNSSGLKDRIYARARRDFAVVRAALGSQLPAVTNLSREDVIKEIQSHTWVQAQVGGRWEDLDTSFSDAAPGKAYSNADKTADAPTSDMLQQVTIRVTTETLAAGDINKTTAIEVTLPAYQLLDQQIFVTHAPPGLKGLLGASDTLSPMIEIAGDTQVGKPVAFAETKAASQGKIGGVAGAFGTAAPEAPASALIAEWLEFDIRFPDGRTETTRRILIDRAGPAWRSAATHDPLTLRSLKRDAQGVPLEAKAVYNVCLSAGGHDLYAYAQAAQSFLHSFSPAGGTAPAEQLSFEQSVWPLALRDLGWMAWSDQVAVPSLNDSPNLRFYADSPRIFVFGFGPDPQGRPNGTFTQSDLRRDTLRGLSRDPSGNTAIIEHKLWFGALEGALEHEMVATDAAGSPGQTTISSTSGLLTPDGVVVLRPGSNPQVSASDKNTAALMTAALAAGDTLVVPRAVLQGGPGGWWQIARTGADTRAVLGEDLNMANSYSLGGRAAQPAYGKWGPPPGGGGGGGGYKPPAKKGVCGSEYSCLTMIAAWVEESAYRQIGLAVVDVVVMVVLIFEAGGLING